MSKTYGIDVSVWQGNFDFKKAKDENVKFVVLRGAYSCPAVLGSNGGLDSKFEAYYKNAKSAGLPVGLYQYSMATSVAQAKDEAKFLYDNCLKGKRFELPIYIDVEDAVQTKLGKRLLTDIVLAWAEYLESKGCYVGIYSSQSYFNSYLYDKELQGITHWIAQWGTSSCTYSPSSLVGLWQYAATNKVAGVVVDQDYMYQDFPNIIKNGGYNGYTKPKTTETAGTSTNTNPKKAVRKKASNGNIYWFRTDRKGWYKAKEKVSIWTNYLTGNRKKVVDVPKGAKVRSWGYYNISKEGWHFHWVHYQVGMKTYIGYIANSYVTKI